MTSEIILMQVLFGIIVYQVVIFFATMVADYQILKKLGWNKWLGIIPIVNDFMLFDIFWKRPLFFVYEVCYWMSYILSRVGNNNTVWDDILNLASSLIMLILLIGLYDKIAKAFHKGFIWTIALAICYPLFALILIRTAAPDPAYLKAQTCIKQKDAGTQD